MALDHLSGEMSPSPTPSALAWSVTALLALPTALGLLYAALTAWSGRSGRPTAPATLSFRQPGEVALTPAQRCTRWYFAGAVILLGVQALPLDDIREWSRQLASAGMLAACLASGIFLSPLIARREPRGQGVAAYALLGALAVVLCGVIGAGSMRLWSPVLLAALVAWALVLWRGLRYRLTSPRGRALPWLFFLAALSVPAVYAAALAWSHRSGGNLLSRPGDAFAIGEPVRSGFVHAWPENILGPFATALVACLLVLMGVVRERIAVAVVVLSGLLYLASITVGAMDHLLGEPSTAAAAFPDSALPFTSDAAMACDAVLTALGAVPLTVLAVAAWRFTRRVALHEARSRTRFAQRPALMFIVAAGAWNLLGAGILGFVLGLPIVSRSGIGPELTAAHTQAATIGTYGMVACAFTVFCARYMVPDARWPDRLAKVSFWSFTIGSAWTVFAVHLPLGLLHLRHSAFAAAASADSLPGQESPALQWLGFPGWLIYFLGGVAPLLWIICLALEYRGAGGAIRAEESKASGPDWDIPAPELVTVSQSRTPRPRTGGPRWCYPCHSTSRSS